MHKKNGRKRYPEKRYWLYLLVLILIIGSFGRLYFGYHNDLIGDEIEFINAAKEISFSKDNFNMPLGSNETHRPLLSLYTISLSGSIFGWSNLGVRFLNIIISTMSLILLFYLANSMFNRKVALLASFILALNIYNINLTSIALDSSIYTFLALLSMFFVWRLSQTRKSKYMIFLGLALGFGYLARESIVILIFAFIVYLLLNKKHKWILTKKETYLAIILFFLLIAPDIYWNCSNDFENYGRSVDKINEIGLSAGPLSFFLVDLFPESYIQDERNISREYSYMSFITGIILLLGVFFSFRKINKDNQKMLLLIFWIYFLFFTFFTSRYFELWWADTMLLPSVLLTANFLLDKNYNKRYYFKYLIYAFVIFAIFNFIRFLCSII